jgi:hypothetical protein
MIGGWCLQQLPVQLLVVLVVLGLPQDQTWSVVAEQGDGAVQDYNTESLVVEVR